MAKWLEWEEKILRERSGIDRSTSILNAINLRRTKEGRSPRSYHAMQHKSRRMGLSLIVEYTDRQTLGAWAKELAADVEMFRYYYHQSFPDKERRKNKSNLPRYVSKTEVDRVLALHPNLARRCDISAMRYLDLSDALLSLDALEGQPAPTGAMRRVKRLDTEETFESISEATQKTFFSRCTIHRSLSSGKATCGVAWQYVEGDRS